MPIVMSKTPEEKKDSKLQINKGVEWMLQNKKIAQQGRPIPKPFQVTFGKMVALWNRDLHIFFDFSVLIRKQILEEVDHE